MGSIVQVQSQDGEHLEEDALNFLQEEIASEFAGLDVRLTFLPSNSCEFMTQCTAHLDEDAASAVSEIIRSISESKVDALEASEIIRSISESKIGVADAFEAIGAQVNKVEKNGGDVMV